MDEQLRREIEELGLVESIATCHTEGCESAGYPITLYAAERVVCGACRQDITDIVRTEPAEPAT